MLKVLITGSNGQLGEECLELFTGCEYDLYGVDLPEVDLSDKNQSRAALECIKPDLIINCAAYTAVDACENDPSCWKANRDIPVNLSAWAADSGAFLLHVSTDYVFSGDKPLYQPWVETDLPAPVSEYGRSKLAGECAIKESIDNYAILRTAWLYSARGHNFLKTMLRLTLDNPGREIKVVNDQYGSPTWTKTLAQQIEIISRKGLQGLFHASSEGHCTWYEFACAFMEELNIAHNFVPCRTEHFPTPVKRPENSIMENRHAKKRGVNVFQDWRVELRSFVRECGASLLKEMGD
ncbi:MAG: dTDP-4-dehydrorhamnose reductase [Kiritimatiellia bacterium]